MINHIEAWIIFPFKRMTKWHLGKDSISYLSPLSSFQYMAFARRNNSIDYYSAHAVHCTIGTIRMYSMLLLFVLSPVVSFIAVIIIMSRCIFCFRKLRFRSLECPNGTFLWFFVHFPTFTIRIVLLSYAIKIRLIYACKLLINCMKLNICKEKEFIEIRI